MGGPPPPPRAHPSAEQYAGRLCPVHARERAIHSLSCHDDVLSVPLLCVGGNSIVLAKKKKNAGGRQSVILYLWEVTELDFIEVGCKVGGV